KRRAIAFNAIEPRFFCRLAGLLKNEEASRVCRVRLEHPLGQRHNRLQVEFLEQAFLNLQVAGRFAKQDAVWEDDASPACGTKAPQGVGEEKNVLVSLLDAERALGIPSGS